MTGARILDIKRERVRGNSAHLGGVWRTFYLWGERNTFYTAFPCTRSILGRLIWQYTIVKKRTREMTEAKLASRHSLMVSVGNANSI